MANAIVPRIQGDEYQARVFWLEAMRLYADKPVATRVGYEVENVRAFDDVAVFYDGPNGSGVDPAVRADYFQVKFHVTQAGAFTAEALTNPAFIGAERYSLLQRLRDAQQRHAPTGAEARFIMISPWTVASDDTLAEIVGNKSGEIRLDNLSAGGGRSKMGKVRKLWRTHLELESDEQLYIVLRTLRIRSEYPGLDGLLRWLNPELIRAGLESYPDGQLVNRYDSLPQKLLQEGQRIFSREDLDRIVARERLGAPRASEPRAAQQIGIRSFGRWAEHLEDETDKLLDLLHHFDGRSIRDKSLWNGTIGPGVRDFLSAAVDRTRPAHLHLDAHSCIAFTAGWVLDPKSGMAAHPVQRGVAGKTIWSPTGCPPCEDEHVWTMDVTRVDGGPDLAIVLNVTRSSIEDALPFIRDQVTSVGEAVALTVCGGIGAGSVRNAAHARRLADDAVALIAKALAERPRSARIHVFASAPNALMFFLGQMARVWGRCVLYEHDFERVKDAPYAEAIHLPLVF